MATITDRLKHAWNAFQEEERPKNPFHVDSEPGYSFRQDKTRISFASEKSTVSTIYSKIAVDVASIDIRHVRTDDTGMFKEIIKSELGYCLSEEANVDQTGRELIRDAAISLCEWGTVAIVPVDTTLNPNKTGGYDIKSLRVGRVVTWYPQSIKVDLYDERQGKRKEIIVPKKFTAIVENPFYDIMNEPNSTLKRLINKLSLLDSSDQRNGAGKLDLIIQLPYVVKNETKKSQADKRRRDLEDQLKSSTLGIGYTDASEKITQLNRPVENELIKQVDGLKIELYNQLGLTEAVFDGTASEEVMTNYYNRTIEPIISAITEGMNRKFLTKTARAQGQKLMFFRNPFKLVTITKMADVGDKFTRNEIMSSNEIRSIIGLQAVDDPRANELKNKNMPDDKIATDLPEQAEEVESEVDSQNGI